jgi:sulfite reductase (ferredoxin)
LRLFAESYVPEVYEAESNGKRKDVRHRVTLSAKSFELLKQAIDEKGASMKDLVEAALVKYLE